MNEMRLKRYGDLLLVSCETRMSLLEEDHLKLDDKLIQQYEDACQKMTDFDSDSIGTLDSVIEAIETVDVEIDIILKRFYGLTKTVIWND